MRSSKDGDVVVVMMKAELAGEGFVSGFCGGRHPKHRQSKATKRARLRPTGLKDVNGLEDQEAMEGQTTTNRGGTIAGGSLEISMASSVLVLRRLLPVAVAKFGNR
ncbi:uncharacterized protein A4U43_C08F13000 [Asparagus officinalis]|nr:uncharacterized protein A4U43_C08F13000 [Asparagus officinalis]